jgi:hypothetical protein
MMVVEDSDGREQHLHRYVVVRGQRGQATLQPGRELVGRSGLHSIPVAHPVLEGGPRSMSQPPPVAPAQQQLDPPALKLATGLRSDGPREVNQPVHRLPSWRGENALDEHRRLGRAPGEGHQ